VPGRRLDALERDRRIALVVYDRPAIHKVRARIDPIEKVRL
jgi:hypothetical protein